MTRAFEFDQAGGRGNKRHRGPYLLESSKRISRTVQEKRRRAERRKVLSAQFAGTPGRMQRIGKQEQCLGESGLLGSKQRRLPSSIRVATEEHSPGFLLAAFYDVRAESGSIRRCFASERWTMRTALAEWQVNTNHPHATRS